MQIAIIQFPGSNCERETMHAVKRANMQPVEFLWNSDSTTLADFAGYIIVGGFSYEDRARAGVIAALDPIMNVLKVQSELGKPILGICNGAQILVETGLVPGLENNKVGLALTENKRIADGKILGTGYYNAWVNVRLCDNYQRNAFTRHLTTADILHIPVAHAEGRFVISEALLAEMNVQGLGIFRYCDTAGQIQHEFPINPNGSIDNIAAIANKRGNVLAMMPHPERCTNGDAIFHSMRDYITSGIKGEVIPLYYYLRPLNKRLKFNCPPTQSEIITSLMITDNHALTVQTTLQRLGFAVTVKRYQHWVTYVQSPAMQDTLVKSGVLLNERKEKLIAHTQFTGGHCFLVRAKEDVLGLEKLQQINNTTKIQGLNSLEHGVLWQFFGENLNIEQLLQTNIIYNSSAHDLYAYGPTLS